MEQVDLNLDSLLPAMASQKKIYMTQKAVILKTELKLIGAPKGPRYRIKHPALRYSHVPSNFIIKNTEATGPSDYWLCTSAFTEMTQADITCLCTYFGVMNNKESKCRHTCCLEVHNYLFDGIEKFINECSKLEKNASFEVVYTNFSSFFPQASPSNSVLSSKLENCFWLDPVKGSVLVKIMGNAIIPAGESCFPLISTIVENYSFDIKLNSIDLSSHPEIISARIVNSKIYIVAHEGCSIKNSQLGTINNLNIAFAPIVPHKLIAFELFNFKNSVWPMRALTDKIISFFMQTDCFATDVHWSFASDTVKKYYDLYIKNAGLLELSKEQFINELAGGFPIEDNMPISAESLKNIKSTLQDNRSFYFICPTGLDLDKRIEKIRTLLAHFTKSRVLTFTTHVFQSNLFQVERDVDKIYRIKSFFPTAPIFKGQVSLILLKPNAQYLKIYELLEQHVLPYANICDFTILPQITDTQFNGLYSNCLNRPYGAAWKDYMTSGPCVALLMISPDVEVLRKKCCTIRALSGISWTKNVLHCSANKEEAKHDLEIFYGMNETTLTSLNAELIKIYALEQPIQYTYEEEFEPESFLDDQGLPWDFPTDLRNNPQIVSFMNYIGGQAAKKRKF